jgi:hypothetical protein
MSTDLDAEALADMRAVLKELRLAKQRTAELIDASVRNRKRAERERLKRRPPNADRDGVPVDGSDE